MIPHERSLVDKLKDKPFALLGVNSDKDHDELKKKLTDEKMTWRHFWDRGTGGPIAKAWNVHRWPTTFVIDQDGVIRHRNLRDEAAEKAIDALLAAMPSAKAPTGPAPAKK